MKTPHPSPIPPSPTSDQQGRHFQGQTGSVVCAYPSSVAISQRRMDPSVAVWLGMSFQASCPIVAWCFIKTNFGSPLTPCQIQEMKRRWVHHIAASPLERSPVLTPSLWLWGTKRTEYSLGKRAVVAYHGCQPDTPGNLSWGNASVVGVSMRHFLNGLLTQEGQAHCEWCHPWAGRSGMFMKGDGGWGEEKKKRERKGETEKERQR